MPYPFVAMNLAHFPRVAGFVTTPLTPLSRTTPLFKNNTWENP
jgi:hypothetical protein